MEYLHFLTDETEKYLPLHEEDKDKYIVLTCAKNEDKYLVEFVEHYLNLGFDKIIIADNNDEPTIEDILSKYIKEGKVEIYDFRKVNYFQVQLYTIFAHKGNYKWCAYFDADEFLEIGSCRTIKEFLNPIKENCVLLHWLNFGSNGEKHYKDELIQKRFPLPVSPILYFKENCFVKSIVRGGDYWNGCNFNGSHLPYFDKEKEKNIYNDGGYETKTGLIHCYYPLRYKYAYLKHYYTKSFDEWMTKSNRGWPDGTPNLRTSTFFGFEDIVPFDFNKVKYAAFGDNSDYYDNITKSSDFFKNITEEYSVIQFINESKLIYALIVSLMSVMKVTTNHTYIITDKHIDDMLYGILLECAYHTGNRLVFCDTQEDVYRAFLKYKRKEEETYYIVFSN